MTSAELYAAIVTEFYGRYSNLQASDQPATRVKFEVVWGNQKKNMWVSLSQIRDEFVYSMSAYSMSAYSVSAYSMSAYEWCESWHRQL